jgi:plasmid stabilization system protein ParE
MAFKIIWSQQARDDLRDIVAFIAADDPHIAESFGLRLISKVDLLAQFPQLGRIVPEERDENIREIVLSPYRIIYRVMTIKQLIAVARIWHGARGEPNVPGRLDY